MSEPSYYDGTKLLSLMDKNGKKPELYLCTTNRSGGKTTYFSRFLTRRFLDGNGKFMLLNRYKNESDEIADKFFKDIGQLFFPSYTMTAVERAGGAFTELFLNEKSCGYCVALNSADSLKKYSHLLSDTNRMFMDEFQSETNTYLKNEIQKLMSIHKSVARGQGKQVRYVPVYLCANTVSLINPYYTALGISERLNSQTKFLRGDGFVLEQGYVESAARASSESGFERAFSSDKYTAYSQQGVYLNDNLSFIAKPSGRSRYLCTLRYNGCDFAIREYRDQGIVYCDTTPDNSFPLRLSVTTDDHNINYVMIKSYMFMIQTLRYYFDNGSFRFKDLRAKEAVMKAISY